MNDKNTIEQQHSGLHKSSVLAAGIAAGQGMVIFSLQPDHKGWLRAAVPACLGSGLSLYAVALLWTSTTARGT